MKVENFLVLGFLFVGVSSKCPPIPNISIYLQEAKDKLTDATNEVVDYYISEVGSDANIDKFMQGVKDASGQDYNEALRNFGRARKIIVKISNATSFNFLQAYRNGGFMNSPLSCYNKVSSQIRIDEEKTKVEYESLISRLSELFEFYFSRRNRSRKSGPPSVTLTSKSNSVRSTTSVPLLAGRIESTKRTNSKPTTKSKIKSPETKNTTTKIKSTGSKTNPTGTKSTKSKTKPTGTKTKKTEIFKTTQSQKVSKKKVGLNAPVLTTTKEKIAEMTPSPTPTLPSFTKSQANQSFSSSIPVTSQNY